MLLVWFNYFKACVLKHSRCVQVYKQITQAYSKTCVYQLRTPWDHQKCPGYQGVLIFEVMVRDILEPLVGIQIMQVQVS